MYQSRVEPQHADKAAAMVLGAISVCHMLNDMLQALLPAVYPILRGSFNLTFAQVGMLTLVYQMTASILQPLIGFFTDRRPQPYSLPFGMGASILGLTILANAHSFPTLVFGGALLGLGSSVFHPEASRIARLASGGAHGLAQSIFQVGGNLGSALGPLLAAIVVAPQGQRGLVWFAAPALVGIGLLTALSRWYKVNGHARRSARPERVPHANLSSNQVIGAMAILVILSFSKFVYLASITNFYTFYLMHRFALPTQMAQVYQSIFFAAVAIGTVVGGLIGDRIGRKRVIWASILGILPFTLALPYVGLTATICLSVVIGLILSSAFPAIVVYAQELMPGRTGLVSGLFFGLIFGIGGISAAALGELADAKGVDFVYQICSFLPLIGLVAMRLPDIERSPQRTVTT